MPRDPVVLALLSGLLGMITTILGVVVFGMRALINGQIIPRSTYLDVINDRDQEIKDRKEEIGLWRAAYEKASAQRDELMVVGQTTVRAIASVADVATKGAKE